MEGISSYFTTAVTFMPWISGVTVSIGRIYLLFSIYLFIMVLIFTQNLLDSHCSVALAIDRVNKTAMGIYWYSNVNGRRERVEWYGNPFERPGVRKPCFLKGFFEFSSSLKKDNRQTQKLCTLL